MMNPNPDPKPPKPMRIAVELKALAGVVYQVKARAGAEEELAAFTQSAEVLAAAQHFAQTLDSLWQAREEALKETQVAPSVDVHPIGATEPIDLPDAPVPPAQPEAELVAAPASEPVQALDQAVIASMLIQEVPPPPAAAQAKQVTPLATASPMAMNEQASMPSSSSNEGSPVFSLPNAKAGQDYLGLIKASGSERTALKFRKVAIPEGLGLSFDADTGALRGRPVLDGEHRITWEWSALGEKWYLGACTLLVNPDPRSLWKVLEPPADAPYRKPHTAGETLDCGGFKITAGSRRGRSHEHTGGFRDDDFRIEHDPQSEWAVMIVCDGAGSARNSRWGSKLACEIGGQHLMDELRAEAGRKISALLDTWETDASKSAVGVAFHNMFYEAAKRSVQAIEGEASAQGATPRDYSTTMLAVAVRKRGDDTFLATFWMGDGAIGVYGPKGKVRLMGAPDGGDFVGQTRFLDKAAITDPNFGKRISVGRYSEVLGVLAMTDGISDPSFETDSAMSNGAKWDELWASISPSLAAEAPHDALVAWMDFFTSGHHDDRTLAVLW